MARRRGQGRAPDDDGRDRRSVPAGRHGGSRRLRRRQLLRRVGPTAATSNTTAALRKRGGCFDSDNNNIDFSTRQPRAAQLGVAARSCIPLAAPIHDIQGSGLRVAARGQDVITTGIVTGVKIERLLPAGTPMRRSTPIRPTSEGIFVFTSADTGGRRPATPSRRAAPSASSSTSRRSKLVAGRCHRTVDGQRVPAAVDADAGDPRSRRHARSARAVRGHAPARRHR